ncbi:hypothetical protein DXG01_002325, partial [Tephrocybe rancida]
SVLTPFAVLATLQALLAHLILPYTVSVFAIGVDLEQAAIATKLKQKDFDDLSNRMLTLFKAPTMTEYDILQASIP